MKTTENRKPLAAKKVVTNKKSFLWKTDLKFPNPKVNLLCIIAYILISNANPWDLGHQWGHSGTNKTRESTIVYFSVIPVNDEYTKFSNWLTYEVNDKHMKLSNQMIKYHLPCAPFDPISDHNHDLHLNGKLPTKQLAQEANTNTEV